MPTKESHRQCLTTVHLSAEATFANRLRRVPLGRSLTPEDIARAVLYFSCEDSARVMGTSLVVDAGYLAAAEWDTHQFSDRRST